MVMLTVLKKSRRKEQEMRVLILGLDNSGKTTFLNKLCGFNIKTVEHNGWKLNCWDVGGQKCLRPYWRNYFERTDAVIWVVDSSDTSRIDNDCRRELNLLLDVSCLHGVTLLILANKCDLNGSLDTESIQKLLKLESITKHRWRIFRTSAYTGENLLEALEWLCNDISSKILVE
ncbi:unnamed protein product [Meloidogyne enterolobii]|uniref:Uncharacterized protein n=1 Tax=Meloidogyne enterolobii TaxID=390850 RepID=A0ACB0YFD3_MELEN